MPARPESISVDAETQKKIAIELFNHVWTLLEMRDRTAQDDDLMVDAAHASRLFWEEPGGPANHARGEWQISRVYATVGRPEPALHHARRCLEICEQYNLGGFDLAYAYEALARAHGLAGDGETAARWQAQARQAADAIDDAEDRERVIGDLGTLPG